VEALLPVVGHLPGRAGSRLVQRVVRGRGESRAVKSLLRPVVVEPVLTWLEASDDPMTCSSGMSCRVLAR